MIFDKLLSLCENKALGTALTSSAIDLGQEKPGLGAMAHPFYLLLFTKGATGKGSVTFKVQDSADNSSFSDVITFTLTADNIEENMVVPMPLQHRQYLRLVTTVTATESNTVAGTLVEAVLHKDYELIRTAKVIGYDIISDVI